MIGKEITRITKEMTFEEICRRYDQILESKNELDIRHFLMNLIDYMKEKEIPILKRKYHSIVERDIMFERITRAYKTYGTCKLHSNNKRAEIKITKHILLPGNGMAIINVIGHEVLHALLPFKEGHGSLFKMGMKLINEKLGTHIQTKGLGEGTCEKAKNRPYLYEEYCPKCGEVVGRYKICSKSVKHPEKYYHNPCKVPLKVRKINKEMEMEFK